jgi:hypothetical protein
MMPPPPPRSYFKHLDSCEIHALSNWIVHACPNN